MRQIKFRAWDEDSHLMRVPTWEEVGVLAEQHELNSKQTLMQFTGLKDKNNKEIWEGDLITENSNKGTYPPRLVEWQTEKCRFASSIGGSFFPLNLSKDYVVGNIYENNEFLTY